MSMRAWHQTSAHSSAFLSCGDCGGTSGVRMREAELHELACLGMLLSQGVCGRNEACRTTADSLESSHEYRSGVAQCGWRSRQA